MKLKRLLLPVLIVCAMLCLAAFSLAGCSKEAASVTLIVDNSVYGIVKVRDGSESLPEDPAKDLYTFDGWYEDKELKTQFDFSKYCSDGNRGDITVYAGFTFSGNTYNVTLNGNGGLFGTDKTKSVSVRERETVNAVTAPVRENYVLTGWSENREGTKPWKLDTNKVTSDTVLYAMWARIYTVTFDAGNGIFEKEGTDKIKVSAVDGSELSEPAEPTQYRHIFIGWSTQRSAYEPDWDFEKDTVKADITLYAVWQTEVTEHNVEYVLNYEGAKNEIKPTVRGLIAYEPEREGYIFNGWWNSDGRKDADGNYILTTRVDLTKQITDDKVKVYAYWIDEDDICAVLPTPVVTVSGSTISWTKCEGAYNYDVVIWHETQPEENPNVSTTVNETTYTLSSSNYGPGIFRVKVRAKGDGYTTVNSNWSSVRSFMHKALTAPSVSFDITTSYLSWSKVQNASKYELYIDDVLIEAPDRFYEYDLSDYEAGSYQIKVVVTASNYTSATASTTVNKLKLKTPEVTAIYNESTKAYELRWNAVRYADCYLLKINNSRFEETLHKTNCTLPANVWGDKEELTYKVSAFNSNANYLISDSKTEKLGKPTDITVKLEGGTKAVTVDNGLASFCRLSFDSKGGSKVFQQAITSSSGIIYPDTPVREGYLFTGWYEDYNCKTPFDFTKEIKIDTTVYAGWYKMPTENSLKNTAFTIFNPKYPNSGIGQTDLSNTGTSSAKRNYVYFCTLTSGDYRISYQNGRSGTNYGTYFYVYNLTKQTVILARTAVNTTERSEVSFKADAGDIIYIENYRVNEDYNSSYTFFVYGGKAPEAGGKLPANHLLAGSTFTVANDKTFKAGLSTVITLTAPEDSAKEFVGWYDGNGKLISSEQTINYTVEGETTLTAKWE